jgi:phenylalanine ammonia-lyase
MDHADNGLLKQDRYPLRTAAHWLGPAVETVERALATVTTDLNSVLDNPLVDHRNGHVLHCGNFQVCFFKQMFIIK